MSQTDDRYDQALKRVRELKEFYIHLGVYVIVIAGLFAINMITNPDSLWFHWPMLGWGIAVVLHGFGVFTEARIFGPGWEEKKARQLLERQAPR